MEHESARPDLLIGSGEVALVAGLYLAEDHYHDGFRSEVVMGFREKLPNCQHCNEKIVWRYVGRL